MAPSVTSLVYIDPFSFLLRVRRHWRCLESFLPRGRMVSSLSCMDHRYQASPQWTVVNGSIAGWMIDRFAVKLLDRTRDRTTRI